MKKKFDDQVAPRPGVRGSCTICGCYGALTESHVLPKSIGNKGRFQSYGYNATSSGSIDHLLPRTFRNGVALRTLCVDCNRGLGSREDQVLRDFSSDVRKALRPSLLLVPDPYHITTFPQRLFRAILASFATSNDAGYNTGLDQEIRRIFDGSLAPRASDLRVYYWPYTGPWLTLIRNVWCTYHLGSGANPIWLNVLKFKPVAFAVTNAATLFGLPCLNPYFGSHIDHQETVPIWRGQQERDIHWPAHPGRDGAILTTSEECSFVATASWRNMRSSPR